MVGDWVYNKHHGKNIRLTQYDFFTHTHNEFGEQELAPFAKPTIGKDLEPILLTPEILEKNGFSNRYDGEDDLSYAQSCGTIIGIHICGKNGLMDEMYFKYIHELQQALRLCGISKEIEL